ncbi:MAG: UDP-N-acetylmuramoyl-L-alanyl-D-glutamate--2,6-diaminopimelate ligase [Acidiferrobacteraceae bacterium]
MSIALSELLSGVAPVATAQDCVIHGVTEDSRRVAPGFLFLALPGLRSDGRRYIDQAIERGAAAILAEAGVKPLSGRAIPVLEVHGLAAHVGLLAGRFFGTPSKHLTIIGITGTNGKTTCAHVLAQALNRGQRRCAVLGTVGNGFPGALRETTHTTLDPIALHSILSELAAQGATDVAMEVSSHALVQDRVAGLEFSGAVLTNISRDHLDYHGTMDAYAQAKARLFEGDTLRYAVFNTDDPYGVAFKERIDARGVQSLGFGSESGDVRILDARGTPDGLHVRLHTPSGTITAATRFFGRFNAFNLAAVVAVLLLDGHTPFGEIEHVLSQAEPVPGRMERLGGKGNPLVFIDYAHTPDALDKALRALREHARGRLLCVFGCGGNRDAGKRPAMGRVAEQWADAIVITDDNPRRESADAIIKDILSGIRDRSSAVQVVRNRHAAISAALHAALPDDIVLVAGKGHEEYQEIGDERLPFSDRESVRSLLESRA